MTSADVTERLECRQTLFCAYAMTAGTLLWHPAIVKNDPKYRAPLLPAYAVISSPVVHTKADKAMNGARLCVLSAVTETMKV